MSDRKQPGIPRDKGQSSASSITRKPGITYAYQTDIGMNGRTPAYHKEAGTLRKGWENKDIPKEPASRKEIDHLKAGRKKPQPQPHLIPKGLSLGHSRNVTETKRENKIKTREQQLGLMKGVAKRSFNPASRRSLRGPSHGPER